MTPLCLTDKDVTSKATVPDSASIPREPVPTEEDCEWAMLQISPLIGLQQNWDGYGADAPNEKCISFALASLTCLSMIDLKFAPDVIPLRDGGINLTWTVDSSTFEIEFCPGNLIRFTLDEKFEPVPATEILAALGALICFFSNSQRNAA